MFGPFLNSSDKHSSVKLMIKLLNNRFSSLLPITLPTVDVRDAALVNLLLINLETTYGKRFNVCQGTYELSEISEVLADEFKYLGLVLPSSSYGTLPIKLAGFADSSLGNTFFHCGKDLKISTYRLRELVDIKLRSVDETVIDMAYQIIDKGLINKETDSKQTTAKTIAK